jgi:uncharacterized protein (TIGR02246 family)
MAMQNLARTDYRREEAYASTDAFLEAYSRGDATACAAFYTSDATVLPGDRPIASGREEIEGLFAKIFEQGVKKLTLIPGEVSCDRDLAYEIGTAILEVPQSDGSLLFDERRYLTVLKRQSDGSWRMQASAWRGARGGSG